MIITVSELERELATLVGMIRHLSPALSHRPELFHEQKGELARFTEQLRDRVRGAAPVSERSFTTPATDTGLRVVIRRGGGRQIPIERRRNPTQGAYTAAMEKAKAAALEAGGAAATAFAFR